MMSIEDIVFWHWWVFALVFLVFEMIVTAYFFLWLAAAAVITGFITLLITGISWTIQCGIWSVVSILCLAGWRFYRKKHPRDEPAEDHPKLNQRGRQYIGRTFTLSEDIVNGQGKIKVDDSIWKIEATEDMDSGEKVKVINTEGTVLRVIRH